MTAEPIAPAPPAPPQGHSTLSPPSGQDERAAFVRKMRPAGAIAAAVLCLGLALNWFVNGRYEIRTDNAHVRADITQVASKVQGYVQTIHVVDNQLVKTGDLLITLESDDYAASLAEARAALERAKADEAQARARVASQRAAIASAEGRSAAQADTLAETRAAEQSARASADLSASDLRRYQDLADKGWYPRARMEAAEAAERSMSARLLQAQAAVTAQESQLKSLRAGVSQARQELGVAEAAARSATALVQVAEARLRAAELNLGRSEIRAPIDGVIANRNAMQGQLLSPGQIALAIVPENQAYVIANFKETQVRTMRPGQTASLTIDAYPGLKVSGIVESIAPATGSTFSLIPQDTATGNFTKIVQRVPVRIAIAPEALSTGLMRSGLATVVTVSTRSEKR